MSDIDIRKAERITAPMLGTSARVGDELTLTQAGGTATRFLVVRVVSVDEVEVEPARRAP